MKTQPDMFTNIEHEIESNKKSQEIHLGTERLTFFKEFLPQYVAQTAFAELSSILNWTQPKIAIAGKRIAIPRLQAWCAEKPYQYTYSGQPFIAERWPNIVETIKRAVEARTGYRFNSVLCNLYRDGKDSVSWHADNEPELGPSPVIASVSFGATRVFKLRPIDRSATTQSFSLDDNSLLVMHAGVQEKWQHQIPKTRRAISPRINLTFRYVFDGKTGSKP